MKIMIPQAIKEALKSSPLDNKRILLAEDDFLGLSDVYNGKERFTTGKYSLLINTLERYYKGYLEETHNDNHLYEIDHDVMTRHDINALVKEIEYKVPPLHRIKLMPQMDKDDKRRFLMSLSAAYTKSRYEERYTKDDFMELYPFVKQQRELICSNLDKTRWEQMQKTENENIEEHTKDDYIEEYE